MKEIPIVDMKSEKYGEFSEEERIRCLGSDILRALEGIGFVYLLNHGVSTSLQESTRLSALDLFALPLDVKKRYHRFIRTKFNGYTPMLEEMLSHSEHANVDIIELKESWDVMIPDQDMPEEEAPDYCRNMSALMRQCRSLCLRVLAALEVAMDRPGEFTSTHHHRQAGETGDVIRSVYYPPVPEYAPSGAVRCATHSDWGSLTLLMQDDVGGLEVLSKAGEWVAATPIADTILVNVGDLMEVWTGGRIPATKHRIRMPVEERQRKSKRLTLAFFTVPTFDTVVVPPKGAEGYEPVDTGKYLEGKFLAAMPNAHLKVEFVAQHNQ